MKLEYMPNEAKYILHRDGKGGSVTLTEKELWFIHEEMKKVSIRSRIQYSFEDAVEEGWIDMSKGDIATEDFLDEVFSSLEDTIEYKEAFSDDEISEAIEYIAESYGVTV